MSFWAGQQLVDESAAESHRKVETVEGLCMLCGLFEGLGFGGFGIRVWGLGFRVWGLGFRVWGLGFGV